MNNISVNAIPISVDSGDMMSNNAQQNEGNTDYSSNRNQDSTRSLNRNKPLCMNNNQSSSSSSLQFGKVASNVSNTKGTVIQKHSTIESHSRTKKKAMVFKELIRSQTKTNLCLRKSQSNLYSSNKHKFHCRYFDDVPALFKCLLCKRYYSERKIARTGTCNHVFCLKCIKQIFEKYFEKGNNSDLKQFKCPITLCDELFKNDVLYRVLSPVYLMYLSNQQSLLQSSIEEAKTARTNKDDMDKDKNNDKDNNLNQYIFSQHNVIHISSNKGFYFYSKSKQTMCPYCYCTDLFNPKSSKFIVCLKCLKSFCKHCRLEYSDNKHFKLNEIDHCRVCFRNKTVNKAESSLMKQISKVLMQLCIVIVAYVIFLIGCFNYIANCCYSKKSHKVIQAFGFLCTLIIYILILPLLLVLIPYFPLLIII